MMVYTETIETKEAANMKGYFTANGYYGLIDGRYVLFASESDYNDYMAA